MYGDTANGCLGIPLAAFDAAVAQIDTAVKLLQSDDPVVRNLAWDDLSVAVTDRTILEPMLSDMAEFLNNEVRYENES